MNIENEAQKNSELSKVSYSFKHSILDVWKFAEWVSLNFIRLDNCWVHRKNSADYKDTGELWRIWWENYRHPPAG